MGDLAVVGQDPGFGGGVGTMTEELWLAAEALGRTPELHYLRYRRLDGTPGATLAGRSVAPLVPGLDGANVLAAAFPIARRVRSARARFVCAAAAAHGYGAALSDRPYGVWVTTALAHEWAAQQHALDARRRLARALGGPILRTLERATLRRATVLWATSPAARAEVARAAGLDESDVRHVPIPIDTALFSPLPDEEWRLGLERPELVFVGRADDPRKNLPLLLEAFAHVRSALPAARLTLVGDPPRAPLPPGVEALGKVPSVALPLRRAALLVLPSLQEGFGLVVAEALASGVPVLVTPCGGPEELVLASGGGEVLASFEPDELAERAVALLGDERRLGELRERGRAFVVREHDRARLQAALAEALERLER